VTRNRSAPTRPAFGRPPIDAEDKTTFALGLALSLIPRVGIITAFNL